VVIDTTLVTANALALLRPLLSAGGPGRTVDIDLTSVIGLWLFFVLATRHTSVTIDTTSLTGLWHVCVLTTQQGAQVEQTRHPTGGPGRTVDIDTTAVTALWLLFVLDTQQEVLIKQPPLTRPE
jgi:hypothetical protein